MGTLQQLPTHGDAPRHEGAGAHAPGDHGERAHGRAGGHGLRGRGNRAQRLTRARARHLRRRHRAANCQATRGDVLPGRPDREVLAGGPRRRSGRRGIVAHGISTRKMARIARKMGIERLSKDKVNAMRRSLDAGSRRRSPGISGRSGPPTCPSTPSTSSAGGTAASNPRRSSSPSASAPTGCAACSPSRPSTPKLTPAGPGFCGRCANAASPAYTASSATPAPSSCAPLPSACRAPTGSTASSTSSATCAPCWPLEAPQGDGRQGPADCLPRDRPPHPLGRRDRPLSTPWARCWRALARSSRRPRPTSSPTCTSQRSTGGAYTPTTCNSA